MKLRMPEYFKEFHCIADKCSDNCCIGWEIDIDNKTANIYSKISGDFGKKLQKSITSTSPKSFILDKDERCPFLNNKNLCEIFIHLGENYLCNICTEHPRYYEWFDGIKEGGIGLCCEEAAKIIISQNTKFTTYDTDISFEDAEEYDSNIYLYLYNSRNKIIEHLENTDLPFNSRIRNILWYTYKLQQNLDNKKFDNINIEYIKPDSNTYLKPILKHFLTLEQFDSNWHLYLKNCINLYNNTSNKIKEFEDKNPEVFRYLQNISIYFIWRYFLKSVFDLDILSKVKLMAVSLAVIKVLFYCKWLETGKLSLVDCIIITKNYSKEIEYSEDNLLSLKNVFNYNADFSIEKLIQLF